jgi:hypothetical protein
VAESVANTMTSPVAVSGPVLFARYAFPPNHHGYCGPTDAAGFFADGVAGNDHGIRRQARDFDGALPFLELIAVSNGLDDPMDPAVVEAYWLGGTALDRVRVDSVSDAAETVSRHRTGPLFGSLREALGAGALPHHSFTVLCVYPWVRLLADDRRAPQAMIVLDRCRIRWGRVLSVDGDQVQAESQPLTWNGQELALGPPEIEYARRTIDGVGLPPSLSPGDWVTLHWDWVCDTITPAQRGTLARYTARHLALVNAVFRSRAAGATASEAPDG